MKLFLDVISIVVFFLVYIYYGIFYATAAMMTTYTLALIYNFLYSKVDRGMIITWVLIMILGSLTLFLQNAQYIKYKPTLVYWCFAIAFHVSPYFKDEKSILERMIGHQITLPKKIWSKLNLYWMIFFYLIGFVNFYVAYYYTEREWVYFKTFGIIFMLLIATVVQGMYMAKYIKIKNDE